MGTTTTKTRKKCGICVPIMEDGPAASEAMGEGQGVSAGDWPASSEGCPRTEGLDDAVQAEVEGWGTGIWRLSASWGHVEGE